LGVIKNALKFTAGGATGLIAGAVAGLVLAPKSGEDLHLSLRERLRRARLAGVEAKAQKQEELIQKFRTEVNDHEALSETQAQSREQRDQAVVALGLGLNAPGAIAAQELEPRK
jgi:gas vesicle protein